MNFDVIPLAFYVMLGMISILMYETGKKENLNKKKQPGNVGVPKFIRRHIQVISALLILSALVSNHFLLLEVFHGGMYTYLGLAISAIGLSIFMAAKIRLGGNFSSCSNAYLPHDIITTGVYKYIRHPIYTANLIIVFGAFVATGSLWILGFVFAMIALYQKSAKVEEKALSEKFEGYKVYKSTTGRFLPRPFASRNNVKNGFDRIIDDISLQVFNRKFKDAGGFKPVNAEWARNGFIMGYYRDNTLIGGYVLHKNPVRSIESLTETEKKVFLDKLDTPLEETFELACWWASKTLATNVDKMLMVLHMIFTLVFKFNAKRALVCSYKQSYSNLYLNSGMIEVWNAKSCRDSEERFRIFIGKKTHILTAIKAISFRYLMRKNKKAKVIKVSSRTERSTS